MTSKEEYLKRYMSKDEESTNVVKKKKKRKFGVATKITKHAGLKILDDDLDLGARHRLIPGGGGARGGAGPAQGVGGSREEVVEEDEEPTVAEFVDERPEAVKQLEQFRQNRNWKLIGGDIRGTGSDDPEHSSRPPGTGRVRHDSVDLDLSDPRNTPRHGGAAAGYGRDPPLKRRHDSDSDASPPRENVVKHDSATGTSTGLRDRSSRCNSSSVRHGGAAGLKPSAPGRHNKRHDSDSDSLPPRRDFKRKNFISDAAQQGMSGAVTERISPSRRQAEEKRDSSHRVSSTRNNSSSSSQRYGGKCDDSSRDFSPKAATNRERDFTSQPKKDQSHSSPPHRALSASSLPRKSRQRSSDSDSFPPRNAVVAGAKGGNDSDLSPPRRSGRNSDSDLSPPRAAAAQDSDLSPRRSRGGRVSPAQGPGKKGEGMLMAMKTMSGATAGLQSARELADEARRLRVKEERAFEQMDDAVLGRSAAPVLRDKKSGRRRDLSAERQEQEQEERQKEEAAAKYRLWNKGLKQSELQAQHVAAALHEVAKPLARARGDTDLNALQRQVERGADDPMLALIKKNKQKSGQGSLAKPRYSGREPPANRFNIWPGYRWDGVDRSNGFERQVFAKTVERQVKKDAAYKWSVEEM